MVSLKLEATPEELRARFKSLSSRRDIANLLDIEYTKFVFFVYGIKEENHYHVFNLPKNLGGFREIAAPITSIKIIQSKLNQVLQSVYKPKIAVHSYIKGVKRNILTNAKSHIDRKIILNIDLKDFFPSINFGRVQGLFLKPPYDFNHEVAKTLSKICCFRRALPQGAPTSPIISNLICEKLDRQLSILVRDSDCTYTRYADDITFSCDDRFPEAIMERNDGKYELGTQLISIISGNGFDINPDKIKLRTQLQRQLVTGVITNVFPNVPREYIRRVRAMLHAWSTYGLEAAETEFRLKYDRKHRLGLNAVPFKGVVKGKIDYIGMIKGKDHPIYLNFREQLRTLSPDMVTKPETPMEFLIRTSRTAPARSVISSVNTAGEDVHALTNLLTAVNPDLESKRLGVWQTFFGNSNDKLKQSAHSMREVLRLLLDQLAPNEMVIECPWYTRPTDTTTPVTRKMRVRYCLSGYSSSVSRSKLQFIVSLSKFVDDSYAKLSQEAHSNSDSEIAEVKAFLQSGELIILMILLNRKV